MTLDFNNNHSLGVQQQSLTWSSTTITHLEFNNNHPLWVQQQSLTHSFFSNLSFFNYLVEIQVSDCCWTPSEWLLLNSQ
jgi:hypothetical protein